MAKDVERLENEIKELQGRLRKVEITIAEQGLKVGAIAILLITFFSGIGAVINHKLASIAKWWTAQ